MVVIMRTISPVLKQQNMERRRTYLLNRYIKLMYSALMVLQLFSLPCLAQSSGNKTLDVDPSLLLAKAKLLTISRYGVDDVNSIISGLDSQMATIYNTNVIGYQVINIVNNQNHPVTVKFGKNGYVQKY